MVRVCGVDCARVTGIDLLAESQQYFRVDTLLVGDAALLDAGMDPVEDGVHNITHSKNPKPKSFQSCP